MDFTPLTNDQLLELIQAAMNEAKHRGLAMQAKNIYQEVKEDLQDQSQEQIEKLRRQAKAKAEQEEREKAREEQASIWAKKKAVYEALLEHPYLSDKADEYKINIWEGSDLRVYIQEDGRRGDNICCYITGNRHNPPGSVTGIERQYHAQIHAFSEALINRWNPGLRLNYHTCMNNNFKPDKDHLKAYKKALGIPLRKRKAK